MKLEIMPANNMLRMWDASLQRMRFLLPEGGDNFFDFDIASQFTFDRDQAQPTGRPRALVLIQGEPPRANARDPLTGWLSLNQASRPSG